MKLILILIVFVSLALGKIHHISFEEDKRQFIHLLDFGFLVDGFLYVEMTNFTLSTVRLEDNPVGFTLSKGDEVNELLKGPSDCILQKYESVNDIIYFIFDFKNKNLLIDRIGPDINDLHICIPDSAQIVDSVVEKGICYEKTSESLTENDTRIDLNEIKSQVHIKPLHKIPLEVNEAGFSFRLRVNFIRKREEGQYYFIYHNCRNYAVNVMNQIAASYKATLIAKNQESFLPAGEIVYPQLYFGLAVLFFVSALFWIHVLKTTKEAIYKVHYLMAILVVLKTLSLLFHGINYYFISTFGQQRAVWAIVYYIMHLLKGLMLFGVIILIGTGWTFFKNFLTDRDRKLFMIVIPLQVLDNIALIIKEESEIGLKSYSFWMKLFILIDLICCAAVILPVIWSIRHLQEASRTDGKAAFNLKKLKLFRHFYIIIICYIYLTRIVNYLVVFTVPFKLSYIVILIVEVGSWVFYVVTGYKFKPAMNNPYLKLSQNEDDDDYEDVVMQSGALESILRVNRSANTKSPAAKSPEETIELSDALVDREMSHELD